MGSSDGALKAAASRVGLPPALYLAKVQAGEKWCVACKAWHTRDAFGPDASRSDGLTASCSEMRKKLARAKHLPKTEVPILLNLLSSSIKLAAPAEGPDVANGTPPATSARASKLGSFYVATRDGDKKQARARVNHHIQVGLLPAPNTLPCTDCGHVWKPGERRHEYDHHLGYAAEHQLDVQAVCTRCHHQRDSVRTHCVRGHEFNDENTLIDATGRRFCRACRRLRESGKRDAAYWRARRAKKRSESGHG